MVVSEARGMRADHRTSRPQLCGAKSTKTLLCWLAGDNPAHNHVLHISRVMLNSTLLDSRHRLIAIENLFRGTISSASVHPREVVKATLRHNAAAVVLYHNHPQDSPSRARPMNSSRAGSGRRSR